MARGTGPKRPPSSRQQDGDCSPANAYARWRIGYFRVQGKVGLDRRRACEEVTLARYLAMTEPRGSPSGSLTEQACRYASPLIYPFPTNAARNSLARVMTLAR